MKPSTPIRYKDFHVPQPCHEDWEAMDDSERGRFCQSCQKEVIDFTFKTERELNEILASGTWTGCGRFLVKQLGKAPIVESRAVQLRRHILDRWRNGAAAALLFVSLWQIPSEGKAANKSVVCLVPEPQQPFADALESSPNYMVSAILTSEYGEVLPDNFHIVLTLPNGDTLPITTQQGFFGIDLEGRAKPEDTILITVPPQEYSNDNHKSKYELTELKVRLSEGQNLQSTIHAIFKNEYISTPDVSITAMREHEVTSGVAIRKEPTRNTMELLPESSSGRPQPEPLFQTKTPEERAQQRLNKQQNKRK